MIVFEDVKNQTTEDYFKNNQFSIDAFNKKALYLYIREISSCKTQQITKVIKKMKKVYHKLMTQYVETGEVSMRF